MTSSQFLSIFEFICNMFYSFFEVILNIPITNNVDFGSILLIVLILTLSIMIIIRPIKK